MSWGLSYQSGWKAVHIVTASRLDAFLNICWQYWPLVRLGGHQSDSDGGGGPTYHRHCLVLPRPHTLHPRHQAGHLPDPGHHQPRLTSFCPHTAGYQENPAVRWMRDLTFNLVNILNHCIILCWDLIYVSSMYIYISGMNIHLTCVSINNRSDILQACPVPPHISLQIWLRLRPRPATLGINWLPNSCSPSLYWSDQGIAWAIVGCTMMILGIYILIEIYF